ncbi:MAG TPA: hypothetical protein VGB91_02460 [Rhizomicrobium sp.]
MFFRGSRYDQVDVAQFAMPDGRIVAYKRMRFIPDAGGSLSYKVRQGDRPDLASYTALGDPEQFWRLCDVNCVQRPVDLTAEPGGKVQVPGPSIR